MSKYIKKNLFFCSTFDTYGIIDRNFINLYLEISHNAFINKIIKQKNISEFVYYIPVNPSLFLSH